MKRIISYHRVDLSPETLFENDRNNRTERIISYIYEYRDDPIL
jgi:hypothetical protein